MKKILLILFVFSQLSLFAQWGLYDSDRSYVILNVNGTPATKTVWNAGSSGTGFFNSSDFGTITDGQTFQLTAYDIKTWKNGSGNVTGGKFYYLVYPSGNRPPLPTFNAITLGFISDLGSGNQKWGFSGQSNNILSGLLPGAYSLEIYAEMYGNNPSKTEYDGNGGANYIASFKLAPAAFAVTGSGSYCQGSGGLAVGVANSETGVTYTITPGGATQTGTTGSPISFGNQLAGTYTVSGTNAGGTTAMTGSAVITETPLSTIEVTAAACDSYTWALNGVTYTTSGDKTYVVGCVTNILHLTITPSSTVEVTAAGCDSYTWALNGVTYTTSGDKTYVVGCVTNILHLTITPSSTVEVTEAACDSYTWALNGVTYTTSGDKTDVVG
jgi:hypothetical protein